MSRDEEVKDVRLFDRRTIERNIKRGLITRKDYNDYLKSLNDTAAKIASPEERSEEALMDDDDDDRDEEDEQSNGVG